MTTQDTIFARSDAAATIYFIMQFCTVSIQERLLIKSGMLFNSVLSVKMQGL